MIIIAGDSWAVGEWRFDNASKKLTISHAGLEQYIKSDNIDVVNIGKGGSSNLDTVNRIITWIDRFPDTVPEKIFVFQTEYCRDYKYQNMNPQEMSDVKKFSEISDRWISRFYMRLSEIAITYNCKIYIIGGASDTAWFDDMNNDHPGCHIVCQSLTNLIIYNNHKISDPVYSWYTKNSEQFLLNAKKITNAPNDILIEIQKGFERENQLLENPQYFYPDGVHPNRDGHKILYNFLKQQNIL